MIVESPDVTVLAEEAQPVKQPTSWERDWALDEAPIGSVEYRPPPEPLPEEEGGA